MEDFEAWLKENLLPDDALIEEYFPHRAVLFSRAAPGSFIEHLIHAEQTAAPFARDDLYDAALHACGTHAMRADATVFHVNIHDGVAWVLEMTQDVKARTIDWTKISGTPNLSSPIALMYRRLERYPADEGGTSFVGLLGANRDWLLLLELYSELTISFHGPQGLCESVVSQLGLSAS